MIDKVVFDDVARALAAAGSTVHAAEAHGALCGALCARREYAVEEWFEEILPDESGRDGRALADLHAASVTALAGEELEFQPLLPDDEQPLDARVEALGAWCQGFLYGFGAAGTVNRDALPEDVPEVLADLAQISHAGAVGSEALEVEEEAYAELVEFLRVGVQLIYDELAALRAGQPARHVAH
ncbi:MAG: UPF0149 family protein [Gammaproteobacteria bacterium]|nr:UPF0149 family protein [Gammaproteobacteria bacterium]